MSCTLKFENLNISRKDHELIRSFSSEISGGEFIVFTGANGTGKSTFLKTLVGLLDILEGDISFDGKSVKDLGSTQRSRLFTYSNSKKIEEEYIRIKDLVALGRYPYLKVLHLKHAANELVNHYLKEMGIDEIKDKFLNEVSDGELQKASIARALVQDAPVIVMDEPSAFLDYPSKKLLFKLLRELAVDKNKIIICATHDVELASKFGTQFWHLEDGSIKVSDSPVEWA